MNKRKLYISIFIVSVIGLAIVQYQYLKIGLNLAKVQFSQKVSEAGTAIKGGLSEKSQLTVLIEKAITKDSSYFTLEMDSLEDASRYFLKDFINEQLVEQGIKADFDFKLYAKDSLFYLNSSSYALDQNENSIKYPLELNGYLPLKLKGRTVLELQFQNLNQYFLSQLNGLVIPGVVFMMAIVGVIIWVLRSFYWQRNIITTTNEFINNLTHELKTPVFSIGVAAKILEEVVPGDKQPVLQIIKQQVQKLNDHTDKVLELSRLERRKDVFSLKVIDIRPLLKEICENFELLADIESIDFSYTLANGPFRVKADDFHLVNAITNLLDNAKKYNTDKPVIHLNAEIKQQKLIIRVKDNGIGIDRKDLDLIFKKFYRVTPGDKHNVKGYGLGLSYVKRVIAGHSGKLDVVSEKNNGTVFSIRLNLEVI